MPTAPILGGTNHTESNSTVVTLGFWLWSLQAIPNGGPSLSPLLEGNMSLLASYLPALPPLPALIMGDWHLIVSEDSRTINNRHHRWKHMAPPSRTGSPLWSPAVLIFHRNLPSLAPFRLRLTQGALACHACFPP